MATSTPPPSPKSPSPSSSGVSWHSRWAQHLSWLISALSGTLEIEQRTREHEQIKKENERLAVLESKIPLTILQWHQLAPSPDIQTVLADFLSFLQEYGE